MFDKFQIQHLEFLTARPWAECGSHSACCLLFYLFICFVMSVTRPKLRLDQTLNHATCDVYSPKAVETLIHGQCYKYCFLLCVKYIFFWFYWSIGFKGNIKCTKKVLLQPWNALTLQLSLLLRDRSCLLRRKQRSLIYLQFCEYFLLV